MKKEALFLFLVPGSEIWLLMVWYLLGRFVALRNLQVRARLSPETPAGSP